MDFERPSLESLDSRVQADLMSKLAPVARTPRYNLIQVLGRVDAGNYHLLYGDLQYLARQIFPDSADSKFLRAHWSDRVPQRTATQAIGNVVITAPRGTPIPAGIVFSSDSGKSYYLNAQVLVGDTGTGTGQVVAMEFGASSNIPEGTMLQTVTDKPHSMDSEVVVDVGGILGGIDEESVEAYRSRCLAWSRSVARYGKPGDFVVWAIDASAEVSRAWEMKNYTQFGALLIQVVGGNHTQGITQVAGLRAIYEYIEARQPYVPFTVRTPELISLSLTVDLSATEDTLSNRSLVVQYLRAWLDVYARPDMAIEEIDLERAINAGGEITGANVTMPSGQVTISALQYPILGPITWA